VSILLAVAMVAMACVALYYRHEMERYLDLAEYATDLLEMQRTYSELLESQLEEYEGKI